MRLTSDNVHNLPEKWQSYASVAVIMNSDSLVGCSPETLHDVILALLADMAVQAHALKESVKLQSHYAKLLNMYDGGERMPFENAEVWIARIQVCEQERTKA